MGINEEMEGKLQMLEEKVEMWEKREEERKNHMESKVRELSDRMVESEKTVKSQISDVQVRVTPQYMICVHKFLWDSADSTISFDSILSQSDNSDADGGGHGEMNLSTGTFTAGTSGPHMVTVSGYVELFPGEAAHIYIKKNEVYIGESEWFSGSVSHINDQGSRTVIVHLEVGDRVSVTTDFFSAEYLSHFIMCVQ